MKIAHVSDIHIRNLKFHAEYRRVFDDFYRKLEDLRVDLVVNTGDTAHTKTNISPEFVSMASDFFVEVAKICPIVSVLGNHDLNLMNEDREDAITPIVEALDNKNVFILKKSGPYWKFNDPGRHVVFWNFGISDVGNWPRPPYPSSSINIGLFHGSIKNCVTDSNFRMTHVEYDQDIFEGLDFVMMGDIHKRQSFNNGRIWYAGSMIQQNFGEDPDKGFLLWDIRGKNDFDVSFHELRGNRRFYTVKLPDDLKIPDIDIDPGSRVRISPPRSLTLVEQKAVEKLVKKRWDPYDVITLGAQNVGQTSTEMDDETYRVENLRDVSVQEGLLKHYLEPKKLAPEVLDRVIDMNRKFQVEVEQRETVARGVNWRVLKMGWNNVYNYGEGNVIDFSQVKGLTGIFAPNASGKSGLIDVITIGAWDANTKEVPKNVHLINDNKDHAIIILELMANGERYTVQREIERVKQPPKNGDEREWGKTTLSFVRHDRDGGTESLVGELRPMTEENIRRRFGSFDDFMLTGLFAQWDPMDLIMCKETDRKRILFRFLDLDIFEEKAKLAKDEAKEWMKKLEDLEDGNYEQLRSQLADEQSHDEAELASKEELRSSATARIAKLHEEIEKLAESIVPVNSKLDGRALERKRREIAAEIYERNDDTSALSRAVSQFQARLDGFIELGKQWDRDALKVEAGRFEELSSAIFSVKSSLKDHRRHVDDAKRQMTVLTQVPCGDQFPTCRFIVDAFEAKRSLPEHEREVRELEEEMSRLVSEGMKLQNSADELRKCDSNSQNIHGQRQALDMAKLKVENNRLEVSRLERDLADIDAEIAQFEQARKDLEGNELIRERIRDLKSDLYTSEKTSEEIDEALTELHRRMGARGTDISRLDEQLKKMKETRDACSAYEHFLDAMGKDGIALQVLTKKLPLINEEINKVISASCEFGVYIDYSKKDQAIRVYIQYGQYKSRLIELGSGAEKFLASVAIRSALMSISNLPRSNMFIIDEGFGKLDPQNLEAVQRMFDYLKSSFDHVIVISHTDIMKDMVDNTIEITADDEGYAHVELGG